MTTFIITMLIISTFLILEDMLFTTGIRIHTPATSQQLYLGVDDTDYSYLGDADMDFEDYCNWRMNRWAEDTQPENGVQR